MLSLRGAIIFNLALLQRVRMIPKPSTQAPHDPVTPAILYPLGGIKVWLLNGQRVCVNLGVNAFTHPEPPVAFPKNGDFLPRLVIMAIPSTQNPLLT